MKVNKEELLVLYAGPHRDDCTRSTERRSV